MVSAATGMARETGKKKSVDSKSEDLGNGSRHVIFHDSCYELDRNREGEKQKYTE